MYYKRTDSRAVDAESPRETPRRVGKKEEEKEEDGASKEAERKKVERRRIERNWVGGGETRRFSGPCVAGCIVARSAADESMLARIDFARAYLVDNGKPKTRSRTYRTCSRACNARGGRSAGK